VAADFPVWVQTKSSSEDSWDLRLMSFRSTAAILLACLASGTPFSATSPAATVRFGTVCAHCHEGECSGRLSFSQPPEATFEHIRHYAGPADDALAHQLYDALDRMKSDCRYPPLPIPALEQGLTTADLASYLDPRSGDYFLPLGRRASGLYQLAIEFTGGGRVRLEVIDDEFDPLIDRCLTLEELRIAVALTLTEGREYYLRLRPRGPIRVRGMTLTPTE